MIKSTIAFALSVLLCALVIQEVFVVDTYVSAVSSKEVTIDASLQPAEILARVEKVLPNGHRIIYLESTIEEVNTIDLDIDQLELDIAKLEFDIEVYCAVNPKSCNKQLKQPVK